MNHQLCNYSIKTDLLTDDETAIQAIEVQINYLKYGVMTYSVDGAQMRCSAITVITSSTAAASTRGRRWYEGHNSCVGCEYCCISCVAVDYQNRKCNQFTNNAASKNIFLLWNSSLYTMHITLLGIIFQNTQRAEIKHALTLTAVLFFK